MFLPCCSLGMDVSSGSTIAMSKYATTKYLVPSRIGCLFIIKPSLKRSSFNQMFISVLFCFPCMLISRSKLKFTHSSLWRDHFYFSLWSIMCIRTLTLGRKFQGWNCMATVKCAMRHSNSQEPDSAAA